MVVKLKLEPESGLVEMAGPSVDMVVGAAPCPVMLPPPAPDSFVVLFPAEAVVVAETVGKTFLVLASR